jgi:hypothetical protein
MEGRAMSPALSSLRSKVALSLAAAAFLAPSRGAAEPSYLVKAEAGLRVAGLSDPRLDSWFGPNAMAQATATVSLGLAQFGRWSLAAALQGALGEASGTTRGVPSQLGLGTALGGAELRFSLLPRLTPYARLLTGAVFMNGRLGAEEERLTLSSSNIEWATLASVGASWTIVGAKRADARGPALFAFAEAGAMISTDAWLRFEPSGSAPLRAEPLRLGFASPSGPFATIGIGGTY